MGLLSDFEIGQGDSVATAMLELLLIKLGLERPPNVGLERKFQYSCHYHNFELTDYLMKYIHFGTPDLERDLHRGDLVKDGTLVTSLSYSLWIEEAKK